MIATISRKRSQSRKSRSQGRFQSSTPLELLEARQLLTSIPVFTSVKSTAANVGVVALAPMEKTIVEGAVSNNLGFVSFQAQKDQIINLSVSAERLQNFGFFVAPFANPASYIVKDQLGNPVLPLSSGETAFRAPAAGTYTVSITSNGANNFTAGIRPISLDTTSASQLDPNRKSADADKLNFDDGALYAFLDAGGKTLNLSGPTGRGMSLSLANSNAGWGVTIENDGSMTYTSRGGGVSVNGLTVPLPSFASIVISTKARTGIGQVGTVPGNKLFSEVKATTISIAGISLDKLISPMSSAVNLASSFSSQITTASGIDQSNPGLSYGIALGSELEEGNAPLNAAVPYFYLAYANGKTLTYGDIDVSTGGGPSFVGIVDPVDPFFFVNVSGAKYISDFAIGASLNGHLPYTPQDTILHQKFQGNTGKWTDANWLDAQKNSKPTVAFYGHVYARAELSISDLSQGMIPIALSGAATVNLIPDGTGNAFDKIGKFTTDLYNATDSHNLTARNDLKNAIRGTQLGLDGTVTISFGIGGASLSFPASQASAIYDGQARQVYFHTESANPLKGTTIGDNFKLPQSSWDGRLSTTNASDYQVTARYDYAVMGIQLSSGILIVDPTGYTVMGWGNISAAVPANIGSVNAAGSTTLKIGYNGVGTVRIQGTANGKFAGRQTADIQYDKTLNIDVKRTASVVTDYVYDIYNQLASALSSMGNDFWASASNYGQTAYNAVKDAGKSVWKWVSSW